MLALPWIEKAFVPERYRRPIALRRKPGIHLSADGHELKHPLHAEFHDSIYDLDAPGYD